MRQGEGPSDFSDVVRGYFLSPESDEWAVAYEVVNRMLRQGGGAAVQLMDALFTAAPEGMEGLLGAGPLEDLLNWHGDALAGELDAAMQRNPRIREGLGSVRIHGMTLELPTGMTLRQWFDGERPDPSVPGPHYS